MKVLVATVLVASAASVASADPGNPVDDAVAKAFGGADKRPRLPMISPDGRHVAVDLGYGSGGGDWHTVAYGWIGAASDKVEDSIVLYSAADADKRAVPDARALATAAARVTAKFAGYTSLPGAGASLGFAPGSGKHTVAVGKTKLVVDMGDKLAVTWIDEHGKPRHVLSVPPGGTGPKVKGRCGGDARVSAIFVDEPHMHLVLRVSFMGHDTCADDPPEWHVF